MGFTYNIKTRRFTHYHKCDVITAKLERGCFTEHNKKSLEDVESVGDNRHSCVN